MMNAHLMIIISYLQVLQILCGSIFLKKYFYKGINTLFYLLECEFNHVPSESRLELKSKVSL